MLWRPHNVHRLVLFNILNAIDFWFFAASNSFNIVALAGAAIAGAAVFVLVLRAAGVERRSLALWAAPAAIAAIFNGAQSECLTWPLGLQWFLVNLFFLCAVLAMLSAAKAEAGKRSFALAACILASIAASLSSGNGLLVWPVLVLLAFALRLMPLWIAGYAAAGAAVIALFLPGLPPADLPPTPASPLNLLAYTANFLGSLWYWADFPFQGATFAAATGYLVFAGAIALGALLLLRRLSQPQQALAAIVIFSVATGFLISTGRLGFGIGHGFAPRYGTSGGLLWAALLAWLALPSPSTVAKHAAGVFAVRAALLFWALIALLAYQPRMLETVAKWYEQREQLALALMVGVHEDAFIQSQNPPERIVPYAEEFRARGKSIFAEPRSKYPGGMLLALAWPDETACTGATETLEAASNTNGALTSYRGHGWIDPAPGKGGAILIANRQGQIIGLGSTVAEVHFPWNAPFPNKKWFAVIRPGDDAMGAFAIKSTAPAPACALGAWMLGS